jgi:hypothetical protein
MKKSIIQPTLSDKFNKNLTTSFRLRLRRLRRLKIRHRQLRFLSVMKMLRMQGLRLKN